MNPQEQSTKSEEWHKKNEDRKDFTYTPLCKNLKDAVYFPIEKEKKELLIKIIDEKIKCLK